MNKHELILEFLNQSLQVMEKYGYEITLHGKTNSVVIEISDVYIAQIAPRPGMTDAIFDTFQIQTYKSQSHQTLNK